MKTTAAHARVGIPTTKKTMTMTKKLFTPLATLAILSLAAGVAHAHGGRDVSVARGSGRIERERLVLERGVGEAIAERVARRHALAVEVPLPVKAKAPEPTLVTLRLARVARL